eukprot:m.104559 g.104559  ORF g.104559 m.104559 type:complete len:66 (+) comp8890_c0_seq4:530-727(+)
MSAITAWTQALQCKLRIANYEGALDTILRIADLANAACCSEPLLSGEMKPPFSLQLGCSGYQDRR